MKRISFVIAFMAASFALAAQITSVKTLTFAWNASTDPSVNQYNFYDITGVPSLIGTTTNLTFVVTNVNLSTPHSFVVTAVNTSLGLESPPSNTVTVQQPSGANGLRITGAR